MGDIVQVSGEYPSGFSNWGRVLRLCCQGLAAGVVACAALSLTASLARSETLESALMQAYQNNPTLNSQRAAMRATDEGVPQALSGYRPKVTITASGGEQSLSTTSKIVGPTILPGTPATYFTQSGYNAPYGAGATVTQTMFNGFQTANKTRQAESPGVGRARDLARDRADGAAQRGDRLHEPVARQRDPRPAAAQRRGAAGAIAADPRPLQCRRGDAHRRGAVGIAAGRRPFAGAHRGIQLQGVGGDLSPGDRQQSGQAYARHAGRSFLAVKPAGRGRLSPAPPIRR